MRKILIIALALIVMITNLSYADWGRHEHERYRYHDGGYWLGGALAAGLVAGAIIESLPPRVTYVNGYYYDGTYYYQQTPNGYVVVASPQPLVIVQPQPAVVIPRDFVEVRWRSQQYYVRDNCWFILDGTHLIQVSDPTR